MSLWFVAPFVPFLLLILFMFGFRAWPTFRR